MPDRQLRQAKTPRRRTTPAAKGISAQSASPDDFLVVGIGASAGGLEACTKLVDAVPLASRMAFILVQHLDPTHESMMVELLASHTTMTVLQATDAMPIRPDHMYVIPPGTYLSIADGALRLSEPTARHGARLPFDFLLHAMAQELGARAACVILSGTGADGTEGLKSIKERSGFVIVQEPGEAAYDGMPRSAIGTGAVDLVLAAAEIPGALAEYRRRTDMASTPAQAKGGDLSTRSLNDIVDLLRAKTPYDFTQYKQGTLQRRIERRMALSGIELSNLQRYLDFLRKDHVELDLLAKDLLINITSFFRDPDVFNYLKEAAIPDLVRNQPAQSVLRIWIAGCSTGEETYSLAMLFLEEIAAAKVSLKLQVFASDVDPDAVTFARDGRYPATIESDVSPARLARFFSREERFYRVSPDLRAVVVFTVQDVLSDPPFSRLDFVSCRNLLIYLRPEAQGTVISLFHFALRDGGMLLLGGSETVGNGDSRFQVISKPARLYRHVGRSRPGEVGVQISVADRIRVPARERQGFTPSRQAALAELCRRVVMETYAPAAVLINRQYECLYSLGPTDRYLRIAPGHATHDLLAMAREGVRTRLRSAIQRATQERTRIVVSGDLISHDSDQPPFSIAVQPVPGDGEDLLLICFVEAAKQPPGRAGTDPAPDLPRVAELEQELEATRAELQGAIRNLELSNEEQKAINEEILSINEEYQSTNEELLTSKEELQSLNEELTALNSQLQETLERQRTTSNDLQNVLYSTNVATLFLDTRLRIRFFTPATKSLFSVIPSDVGRPLADLHSLASDDALLNDAATVLQSKTSVEREIEGAGGSWYLRRILPYRTPDSGVDGVVITFSDTTERRRAADALEAAKREAELANVAKSRFLAAASHDLRQPLQTLALLQGLLARTVEGDRARKLVSRFEATLGAMSSMLNTLLDINQIEAGTVRAEVVTFPINDLLDRLRDEFTYHANAHRLELRVLPCTAIIQSDPRLLEQMLRNLMSNALKYTNRGKVLLGCRRRGDKLSIEVWDTGVGIPEAELQAIFEEYHQLDNAARERSRGLGLGLSIVQRLAQLLRHHVRVRSRPGKGSVFAIEVKLAPGVATFPSIADQRGAESETADGVYPTGEILVVEDDPEVRELLGILLKNEGHRVISAHDGISALDLAGAGEDGPDLILADFNLPNGMNGLQLATRLREVFHRDIPVVILTGDISTGTLRSIALRKCEHLNKPVKLGDLIAIIRRLIPVRHEPPHEEDCRPVETTAAGKTVIFVVDDDSLVRDGLRGILEEDGRTVEDYASSEAFLAAYRPGREACLLVDAYLPGMSGLELLQWLADSGQRLPAIVITGNSDVSMAVQAMKAGATDFLEKPIGGSELLASVERAFEQSHDTSKLSDWRQAAMRHIENLTTRERQIMDLVVAGHPSKNIAADLRISQRTVENHRASIMRKTGSKSVPALVRLALAASSNGSDQTATERGMVNAPDVPAGGSLSPKR